MGFNPDILFIIMLIEKNKVEYLVLRKVDEEIASISSDKFLDDLGYIKEDTVE